MACEFCKNLKWDKYSAFTREGENGEKVPTILLDYGYTFSPEKQLKFCPCCGAKNPNAPKKYYVTLKVHGEYTVEVEAQNWEEAQKLVKDSLCKEDVTLQEDVILQDVEMDFHSYCVEGGEEVYL